MEGTEPMEGLGVLGFRDSGLGIGLGFTVQDSGFRV